MNHVNLRLGKLKWQPWAERDSELQRWNCFPNIGVKAAYLPLEQIIDLTSFSEEYFDGCFASDSWVERLELLPVLQHEVRHWLDYVGTVWGQFILVQGFNAMNARELNDPNRFGEIASFWRAHTRANSESYFFSVTDEVPSDPPKWVQQFSKGNRFDEHGRMCEDRPIIFTSFFWNDGRKACRTPLSILSLLEVNAMFYEIEKENAVLSLIPVGEREVEQRLRATEHVKDLIDPYLSQYSAVAHLVSNALGVTDIHATYEQASQLSALCLNVPPSLFARMKIPSRFKDFGPSLVRLRDAHDPICAFLCILYADDQNENVTTDWLENAALRAGLPSLEEIEQEVEASMSVIPKSLEEGPFSQRAKDLLEIGRSIFQRTGLLHSKVIPLEGKFAPAVVLRKKKFRRATGENNVDSATADWTDTSFRLMNQMTEFLSVCGIW